MLKKKNKVIERLTRTYDIKQEFTLPYCPWSNGSVEIVNRSIKRVLTTAIIEQKLQSSEWPYLLPLVMNAINGSKSNRLDENSPREVFMGLPGFNPFKAIYNPKKTTITELKLEESIEFQDQLNDLIRDLEEMHLKVTDAKRRVREANDKAFRKKHGLPTYEEEERNDDNIIPDVDFVIGDYVLVAIPNEKKLGKLDAIWRGPYQVTGLIHTESIENRIYEVTHLVSKTKLESHATRIKFYADKHLDTRTSMKDLQNHISAQEISKYELENIKSHKFDNDQLCYVVECKWKGFSEEENSFEPLHIIYADTPKSVDTYLNKLSIGEKTKLKQDLKNNKD